MGSPNVVRGGSHLGWASAARLAEAGICNVLSSDYFYPAMLRAALILARRGVLDLPHAWGLISANPAAAAGLADRGAIAEGLRADLVVVDPSVPRVVATIEAVERKLLIDGLVIRYDTNQTNDGVAGHEGTFLLCSFWLVDCLVQLGRHDDALSLFHRLLSLRNDLGLLAEEYDPGSHRLLGNFPQAFSHLGLVNSALNLNVAISG